MQAVWIVDQSDVCHRAQTEPAEVCSRIIWTLPVMPLQQHVTVPYVHQVTCLANSEEELSKRAALVPFLLQDAMVAARSQRSILPQQAAAVSPM